jgi:ubiquinone/menaquinone biosynthesis C-methylase UbiE
MSATKTIYAGVRTARPSVDWNSYAQCYDLLCSFNPAYAELLREFSTFCGSIALRPDSRLLDLGGGTGNFFCDSLPRHLAKTATLVHLDADSEMLAIASAKYKRLGLDVELIHRDASKTVLPVASFDCILSVNALYAMPDPVGVLKRAFHWLRPGGYLFLVDLGRIQNTNDWTTFLVKSNASEMGVARTLKILLNEGMVISKANRRIALAQRNGTYWQHTTDELRATLERIGYEVAISREVYRGYSDLAVATKPLASSMPAKLVLGPQ